MKHTPSRSMSELPMRKTLSYVEQVELHFHELEVFRSRVNKYPKDFERYIESKRTARWPDKIGDEEAGPGQWESTATAAHVRSSAPHKGSTIVSL
eukprot:Skav233698  [mRNA]  locus=scaffold1927:360166:360964:+ [translate_table: standard]